MDENQVLMQQTSLSASRAPASRADALASSWTSQEVVQFFLQPLQPKLGDHFNGYVQTFLKQAINSNALLQLTDTDFGDFNIAVGHRPVLRMAVKTLRRMGDQPLRAEQEPPEAGTAPRDN